MEGLDYRLGSAPVSRVQRCFSCSAARRRRCIANAARMSVLGLNRAPCQRQEWVERRRRLLVLDYSEEQPIPTFIMSDDHPSGLIRSAIPLLLISNSRAQNSYDGCCLDARAHRRFGSGQNRGTGYEEKHQPRLSSATLIRNCSSLRIGWIIWPASCDVAWTAGTGGKQTCPCSPSPL